MVIFDIYDKIIENVQQIPLDVYLYIRRNNRLNWKLKKNKKRHEKILKALNKGNLVDLDKLNLITEKIKRLNKKLVDSAFVLQKILKSIFDKTNETLSQGNEKVIIPAINIENINRIVKVGKIKGHGPNYCICKQKAYDNMIACDNIKCKVKWFHFECAGITLPPKNTWYCFDCRKVKDS